MDTKIVAIKAELQRRDAGKAKGCFGLIGLVVMASLAACSGMDARRAASALDGLRQIHYSLCVERDAEDDSACETAYQRLRILEPGIEQALDHKEAWVQLAQAARPWIKAIKAEGIKAVKQRLGLPF